MEILQWICINSYIQIVEHLVLVWREIRALGESLMVLWTGPCNYSTTQLLVWWWNGDRAGWGVIKERRKRMTNKQWTKLRFLFFRTHFLQPKRLTGEKHKTLDESTSSSLWEMLVFRLNRILCMLSNIALVFVLRSLKWWCQLCVGSWGYFWFSSFINHILVWSSSKNVFHA